MNKEAQQVIDFLTSDRIQPFLSQYGKSFVDTIVSILYEQEETATIGNADDEYLTARLCPNCGTDSFVIESRECPDGTIRRRRECRNCGTRFITREIFEKCIPRDRRRSVR